MNNRSIRILTDRQVKSALLRIIKRVTHARAQVYPYSGFICAFRI